MSELRERERLGEGLSKLPKVDKSSYLTTFVKQQQRNTSLYEVEGRRYLRTWGRERVAQSSVVGSKVSNATDGERRKVKEKDKEREEKSRGGIETPVLKPRNPDIGLRAALAEKSHSRAQGKENVVAGERAKASDVPQGKAADKGHARAGTSKKVSDRDRESDSRVDTATRDKEQRMKARKERRRERREIVNPKRKDSPQRDGEDDSDDGKAVDTKSTRKKGGKSKKQKVPAGLALMHGFSATNVGKSRLTMEQYLRPTGVFSKGKASGKTAIAKKSASIGFSELQFLNKRSVRESSAQPEAVKQRSKGRPEPVTEKPAKKTSKKRAREPSPEYFPTEESSSSSSESEEGEVGERPKRRPRSSSVTWDIEHEGARLPSTDLSVEVPLAKASKAVKSKPQEEEAPGDGSTSSRSIGGEKIRSSLLGPQDSASQCAPRNSSPQRRRPEADTFSKYFQQILEEDTAAQSSGKELAHTIPCPTFVAPTPVETKTPESLPVNNEEPVAVSNDLQDDSQISSWRTLPPDPLQEEDSPVSWHYPSMHQRDMEYEPWQEDSRPFNQDSMGCLHFQARYGVDSRPNMAPDPSPIVAPLEEYDITYEEGQQDYWDTTQQPWEVYPEGQESDFVMEEDFADTPAYDGFDEVDLTMDYGQSRAPWTIDEGGLYEEAWAEDYTPEFSERHGVTDSGCLHQVELDDSQQGELWQGTTPDPLSDNGREDMPELEDAGSMQGLLFAGNGVCDFLQGRSALLGFDVDGGNAMPAPSYDRGERQGATKVEIDVAKSLRNHWRPQRL